MSFLFSWIPRAYASNGALPQLDDIPTNASNRDPSTLNAVKDTEFSNCYACQDKAEKMYSAEQLGSSASPTEPSQEGAREVVPDKRCRAYMHSPCPLNRRELGRAGWALLHTFAAYYPDDPTKEEEREMAAFLKTFGKFYPCGYCADMTSYEMIRKPPKTQSRVDLQYWLCIIHNEVNDRMGKKTFDCNKVDERWRTGLQRATLPPSNS